MPCLLADYPAFQMAILSPCASYISYGVTQRTCRVLRIALLIDTIRGVMAIF